MREELITTIHDTMYEGRLLTQSVSAAKARRDLCEKIADAVLRALAAKINEVDPPVCGEPVLVVDCEPDYWSRGHHYTGSKPWVDPTKVWKLPIGTKLYTAPPSQPLVNSLTVSNKGEVNGKSS